MVDTLTPTYKFTQPEVGGSDDSWGDKLNNNWGHLDTLLKGFFPAGSDTALGTPRISGGTPTLQFLETDAVSPAGQFDFHGYGAGSFVFQRFDGANYATPVNIWRYIGSTGILLFDVPTQFATATTFSSHVVIENTSPSVRFHETDAPAGTGYWQLNAFGSGNNFALYDITATDFSAGNQLWVYAKSTDKFLVNPTLVLGSPAPVLEFDESDLSSPQGHYRFICDSGMFSLQKAGTANFATVDPIFQHRGESGGSDTLNIFKGVSIGGTVGASTASLKIDASYPSIWFADSSPSGGYANLMMSAGNSTMRFGSVDAAGGAFDVFMGAAPGDVYTVPNTRLATTGGTVELGSTAGASLELKRASSYNYIKVPDGAILRIANQTGTAWATISAATGWAAGTSDARMKQHITGLEYGLDAVLALRPVQFDWIEGGKHDIGFIAQEVEDVIPEVVEVWPADPDIEGDVETYAMRKDALTAVLVKALQELTARVTTLEGARHA